MKRIVPLLMLLSPFAFASEVQIEKVVAPKGYILSNDLQAKQCPNIWSKQIGIFMGNNSHIKNPNLILVGQEIQVQNCMQKEVAVEEKVEEGKEVVEVVKIEEKKEGAKEEKNKDGDFKFFVLGSYLNQQTAKKGNDEKKSSEGYKIEIGKYFKVGEDQLKVSLGFTRINSIYSNQDFGFEIKRPNAFLTLDSSYLMKLSNKKFQIGPHLGLIYQPREESAAMRDFKNRRDDSQLAVTAGANAVYSINDDWKIDLKMSNRVEGRLNLWSSIGLEYNF